MKVSKRFVRFSLFICLIIGGILAGGIPPGESQFEIVLITTTDKSDYYLRQKVSVKGNATLNGQPIPNALVALEVSDPHARIVLYRTVPIGNPVEPWILNITNIAVWDLNFKPLNTVKIGSDVLFSVTVHNPQLTSIDYGFITICIYDGNMIPIGALAVYQGTIDANSSLTAFGQFEIPKWAYAGLATVYANVYDREPTSDGIPYHPERSANFYISRTEQGLFAYQSTQQTQFTSTALGEYNSVFRLPPNPMPGKYSVYSVVRVWIPPLLLLRTGSTTQFNVLSIPYPPDASFAYWPVDPYPNMVVTFDASSSSANGYNDFITRYVWNFGDGTPPVVRSGNLTNPPDPIVTHKFMTLGTFRVTLNVTDNEGLWGAAIKDITTKPTNPTALFTWSPFTAIVNASTTFDASASLPGWSIPTGSPAPIDSYVWNFGDNTGIFTLPSPTIAHIFNKEGNFIVTLTVIDAEGQQNTISHTVQAKNATLHPWDINRDGKVDLDDVIVVALAYATSPGDPRWNPIADLTGDGKVDIDDVILVAIHYGETYY